MNEPAGGAFELKVGPRAPAAGLRAQRLAHSEPVELDMLVDLDAVSPAIAPVYDTGCVP